jgi:RNA polymerase sigma factor (TIGR02999 family)
MVPTIASLLEAAEQGDSASQETLFATLYAELHRMARRELGRPGAPMSLGVTTLLHEAYLEMAERDDAAFADRARFMAYAARVMRGLIIDHVRRRQALKRGGQFEITDLDTDVADHLVSETSLTQLAGALDDLARFEPVLAQVVDLKFFCGFSFAEIAVLNQLSERTVQRQWEKARIYLHRVLGPEGVDVLRR